MGNKNQNNATPGSPIISKKPSFLDIKNFTRKKSIPKDDFFKFCEPSIFYGQCIQVEPDEHNFEIKCVFCKCLNFDDGLETPTRCIHCNNLYIAKDNGIQKLPENCNLVDYISQTVNIKPLYSKKCKELNHLILYCNSTTLPIELKVDNKIDYNTIIQKIIIPFFSIKSRAVRFGVVFKIGNFEFKVVSCEPRVGGRITKTTRIHCYRDYNTTQNLDMVKIGLKAGKRTHVNEEDIIRHVTKMRSAIHLSADQNLIINNLDLNIIFASPSNGNLTKETKIELQYETLKEIKTISIACNQNTISKLIKSPNVTTIQEIEEIIRRNYVQPYFQGISRFIEKGKHFSLEANDDFFVRDCNPLYGIVTSKTKITILLLENNVDLPTLHPRETRESSSNSLLAEPHFSRKLTPNQLVHERALFSEDEEEEHENGSDPHLSNDINEHENEDHENEEEDEEVEEEEDKDEEEKTSHENIIANRYSSSSGHLHNSRSPPNIHSAYLNYPPQLRSGQMNFVRGNNNSERNLESFMDNMNDESDSSGGNNAGSSNQNSDNNIPLENLPTHLNHNISSSYDESSLLHRIERERLERDRVRLRYLRPPQLRHLNDHNHQNSPSNEEINNAIHRVLNAFLLFNDPFMQSVLASRNSHFPSNSNTTGATKFQINRLPEHKITKEFVLEKRIIEENLTKCMICLNEYEDQDSVRTMPCMHYFHKNCLDVWLVKCKTCPICKTACDVNEKDIIDIEG